MCVCTDGGGGGGMNLIDLNAEWVGGWEVKWIEMHFIFIGFHCHESMNPYEWISSE